MLVNSANYGHRVGGRGHRGVLCPAPSPRLTRRSAVCVQSFAAWAEDGSCLQRGSRDSQRDYERCLENWDDCVEYAAQAARLHREIHAGKERLVASGGELLSPSVAARRGGWPARGLENGPRGSGDPLAEFGRIEEDDLRNRRDLPVDGPQWVSPGRSLAVGVGFEPTRRLPAYALSRRAGSAAPAPHREWMRTPCPALQAGPCGARFMIEKASRRV